MNPHFAMKAASALALGLLLAAGSAGAQPQAPAPAPATADADKGTFLLTIFLKHDQSKSLDQIQSQLRSQGFYKAFPPPNIEIVSWYVMMGIGQVVTLRVPAERLREVNRAIEQTAWGATAPSSIRPTITRRSARTCTPRRSRSNSAQGGANRPLRCKGSLQGLPTTLPARRSPRTHDESRARRAKRKRSVKRAPHTIR